jgi:uncharacterized protein (TIGR00730 family)
MKRVSVFGGSRTVPGEDDYLQAYQLGQLLGSRGLTVLTGGYTGSMEAVSRGAAEHSGHVIGVTCNQIENWRPVKPNAWVHEEVRFETLRERLDALIESCQAALALPGGPGTLTEIALMWNLTLTQALPPRPLILIGSGWRETFSSFRETQSRYIPNDQWALLSFSDNVSDAVRMLNIETPSR